MSENEKKLEAKSVIEKVEDTAEFKGDANDVNVVLEAIKESMEELEVLEQPIVIDKSEEVKKDPSDVFVTAEVQTMIETPIKDDKEIIIPIEDFSPEVIEKYVKITKEEREAIIGELEELRESMKDYNVAQIHREIDHIIEKYQ